MRSLLRPVTICTIALFLSQLPLSPSLAKEDWVLVQDEGGTKLSIDANSLRRQGNIVWFWLHRQYETNGQKQEGLLYASADCSSRIVRVRKIMVYNAQGELVSEVEPGDEGPTFPASPDDPVLGYACARRSR